MNMHFNPIPILYGLFLGGGAGDATPPPGYADPPAFIWLTVALKVAIKNRLKFVFLFCLNWYIFKSNKCRLFS